MAKWHWKWWQISALAIIGWIVAFSIDVEYDRSRPLDGGLTMVERVHVTRRPYSGMVESTGSFFLPIPDQASHVESWRVMRGDSVIWAPSDPLEQEMRLSFSPDGRRVLLWMILAMKPWRVIDLRSGRSITVDSIRSASPSTSLIDMPEGLFSVMGWSRDSRRVYVALGGSDLKPPMRDGMLQPYPFREVWAIDAATGTTIRVQRCEKAEPGNLPSWTGTACADEAPRS
ncbi:MAG TPA: hypothetical protein VHM67_07050 [Gemmatimonadaceae bacterium]|nr:hypothetical protein [Gemmatimonadaceae bacterium]